MPALKGTYAQDRVHDHWESVYRSNPIQDRLNDAIMDRILDQLGSFPGALFLDAGCGTGDHTLRIAKRGYSCIGVDISANVLRRAARKAAASGLTAAVSFVCHTLEEMPFPDATFDAVHCRGVLMHIPEWERALANLCRVLKPGGRIVILENNHHSLETALVSLVRRISTRSSRLAKTPGGLEFWSEESGQPFVARIANIRALAGRLEAHGVRVMTKMATEFWDVGRFPDGISRGGAIRWNQLYFSLGLPSLFSSGNAIFGEKRGTNDGMPFDRARGV